MLISRTSASVFTLKMKILESQSKRITLCIANQISSWKTTSSLVVVSIDLEIHKSTCKLSQLSPLLPMSGTNVFIFFSSNLKTMTCIQSIPTFTCVFWHASERMAWCWNNRWQGTPCIPSTLAHVWGARVRNVYPGHTCMTLGTDTRSVCPCWNSFSQHFPDYPTVCRSNDYPSTRWWLYRRGRIHPIFRSNQRQLCFWPILQKKQTEKSVRFVRNHRE